MCPNFPNASLRTVIFSTTRKSAVTTTASDSLQPLPAPLSSSDVTACRPSNRPRRLESLLAVSAIRGTDMNGWAQLSVINQRPEASKRSEVCASVISNGLVSRLWLHEFFFQLVSALEVPGDLILIAPDQVE